MTSQLTLEMYLIFQPFQRQLFKIQSVLNMSHPKLTIPFYPDMYHIKQVCFVQKFYPSLAKPKYLVYIYLTRGRSYIEVDTL